MKKMLILGASGLVGRALIDEFISKFDVYGTYFTKPTGLHNDQQFKLDIQQTDEVKAILRAVKPDLVISCLRGGFDQQLQFHRELGKELKNSHTLMYFFSTTNVYDGDLSKAHFESDKPIAESDYGKYKIECEKMLMEMLTDRVMIIRIPAIWGIHSPRWQEIKESIKNQKQIDVYSNLICNNLLDTQLAKQLHFIIEKELKGIFHLGTVDSMTQGQFFEQIIAKLSNVNILRYLLYQNKEETFYFRLNSNRDEIPSSLQFKHQDIISSLLEKCSR